MKTPAETLSDDLKQFNEWYALYLRYRARVEALVRALSEEEWYRPDCHRVPRFLYCHGESLVEIDFRNSDGEKSEVFVPVAMVASLDDDTATLVQEFRDVQRAEYEAKKQEEAAKVLQLRQKAEAEAEQKERELYDRLREKFERKNQFKRILR